MQLINEINKFVLFGLIYLLMVIGMGCKHQTENKEESEVIFLDPAIEKISGQIQQNPKDPNLLYQRANLFYRNEEYDQAVSDLLTAIKLDSAKIEYYHLLSDSYLDNYESRKAIDALRKGLENNPRSIRTLLKLSEFQLILKQYDESIITVNDILALDPNNAEAYFMLGMNFRSLKDSVRAINSFQRAVEIDPELTDSWILLGNLYEAQKEGLALQCYDNAVTSNPQSIEAHHSKAFFLQNHGRIPEAIQIYEKIHLLDPDYADAYLNEGILYIELDSLDRAWEQFNILVGIDPANAKAHYYRGLVQEFRGNMEEAGNNYQSALNLIPRFELAQQALKRIQSAESVNK